MKQEVTPPRFKYPGHRVAAVGLAFAALTAALVHFTTPMSRQDYDALAGTKVGKFSGTIIRPAAITGTQNDWAPTGLSDATTIMVTLSADTTLTGLTGGEEGRRIDLCPTGSNTLTIAHQTTSAAANQFTLPGAVNWALSTTTAACATFVYDGTTTKWKLESWADNAYPSLSVTGVTTTGGLTNSGPRIESATITPAAIVGATSINDWAPANFATAEIIRQDVSTGLVTFTGLAGGAAGRMIFLLNISTDGTNIKLTADDASSAAANRFTTISSSDTTVTPGGYAVLWYDGTTSRWRIVSLYSKVSNITTISGSLSVNGLFTAAAASMATTAWSAIITPSAISGSNNNYSPTSAAGSNVIRQDVSSAATLTGLIAPTGSAPAEGRFLSLINIATSAANTITLTNEDGSSSAANRFTLPNGVAFVIPPGGAVLLLYNGTTSRWNVMSGNSAQGQFSTLVSSGTGTINNLALNAGTTLIEFTGASTLTGMTGGVDGRCIDMINDAGSTQTISHLGGTSSAGNRFVLIAANSMTITTRGGARFCYDSTLDSGSGAWNQTAVATATVTPSTTFSGTLTGSGNVAFSGTNADVSTTGANTHHKDTGTAPTLSSCGTTPSVVGGSWSATVTTGGTATACTITWSRTFTTDPTCTVTSQSGVQPAYTHSATAVTLGTGTAASTIYDVMCIGH